MRNIYFCITMGFFFFSFNGEKVYADNQQFLYYSNNGTELLLKGRYDEAIINFDSALEIDQKNSESYNRRGLAFFRKKLLVRAESDFKEAIKYNAMNYSAYLNLGDLLASKGDMDKAIDNYSKAIELNDTHVESYDGRGYAFYSKGEYDRAIADYSAAVKINSNIDNIYARRGNAYWLGKKDHDKAIHDFKKALSITPNNFEVLFNLGMLFEEIGRYDEAITQFSTAIAINKYSSKAFTYRGLSWDEKGEFSHAISDYRRAIEIDADDHTALNNLAWILSTNERGEFRNGQEAVKFAKEAVLKNKNEYNLATLAAAYAELNNFEKAIELQNEAISILIKKGRNDIIAAFVEKLKCYQRKTPWREKAPYIYDVGEH
jgi:tetratricopeptide (TPR) repeat protein